MLPGQQVTLIGEIPGWYTVELADGTQGHTAKHWADAKACIIDAAQPPASPPSAGESAFELDAIDVGTGLSIFVRGPDFSLLYDAGSNDDKALGSNNRTAAFLAAVHPDVAKIDHVVLSHPHQDHVELLADIVRTHTIGDVWNSGAYNDICGYRAFLIAIADTGVRYHTASLTEGTETVPLPSKSECHEPPGLTQVMVKHSARIDTIPIPLGANARMQFLHIDGKHHSNPNDNSLVLRLDLGTHSVLLMGDAEAGGRNDPAKPPTTHSVEGYLLGDCCAGLLHADVLVVGHHGSKSSSRKLLLDAVGAKFYVVSSGPFPYNGVLLPDQIVIDELKSRGTLLCTNLNDDACKTSTEKIGRTNDNQVGGCSNVRMTIDSTGIRTAYYPAPPNGAVLQCRGH